MTRSNLRIAVTGGIGSGKSEVCGIIAREGYPVFSCDGVYSALLKDNSFVDKLDREFKGVKLSGGGLDRERLAEIVFVDSDKLARLNELTHPAIMSAALKKMNEFPLSFCEVPLLFEGNYQGEFDGVIVVLREKESRIAAICRRDGISCENAILRIKRQFDYENGNFAQYYVIHNNGNLSDLTREVRKVLSEIVSE